jgi:probable rRNA maturation factor
MVINRQRRVRVSVGELEKFLAQAAKRLGLPADALGVCLVPNAQMTRWNRAYRGKRGPTDVLSFPADAERERENGRRGVHSFSRTRYLGDIAISPEVARSNARRFGRTCDEEIRVLILHGMLHLLGYDHETDEGQMDRRERRLRRELGLA